MQHLRAVPLSLIKEQKAGSMNMHKGVKSAAEEFSEILSGDEFSAGAEDWKRIR